MTPEKLINEFQVSAPEGISNLRGTVLQLKRLDVDYFLTQILPYAGLPCGTQKKTPPRPEPQTS